MPQVTSVRELKRIAEGREAEIFAWEDGTVLRLFREARGAAALEREIGAMRAVAAVLPFVPRVLGRFDVDGRPGIVMERVDGPDLLTLLSRRPWSVRRFGALTGELHAQLHDVVAPPELPALDDRASAILPGLPPAIAEAARRELASLPAGDRLCHGDFHPGNVLMSPRGPVIIDWPGAMRADPLADHARTLLLLRVGAVPPGTPALLRAGALFARGLMRSSYARAYRQRRPVDRGLLRRWTVAVAAFRLLDDIPGERAPLLRVLEECGVRAQA